LSTAALLAAVVAGQILSGTPQVIDGDTLRIGQTHVRLFGIDAPESREQCVTIEGKVWRCGQDASEQLRRRIGGQEVRCEAVDTDKYRRTVAVCSVAGEDLQHWMTRQGWARSYPFFSRRYVPDEAAAKRERLGIWR
jgi:endonuclease YncB( thermonuclease family)